MNALSPNPSKKTAVSTLEPLIDWIDRELTDSYKVASGRGGNTLLQLRKTLSEKHLNTAVGGFYRLLPRLERHHFLLAYRIRRWISMNFEALVSDPLGRVEPERITIRENDRNLITHRNRFAGQAHISIPACDLRVQIVGKSSSVREAGRVLV